MYKKSFVLLVLFVILFSLSALAVDEGELIPDFEVTDLQGNSLMISDFRGQYVLYDVWATWCGPCLNAMEGYVENYDKFVSAEIKIVAISVDAKIDDPIKFNEKEKLPFTVLHTNPQLTKDHWGIIGIPTMFLVDPDGVILFKEIGYENFSGIWEKISEKIDVSEL